MSAQFIYTMRKVNKFHAPDKDILIDVTLAFLPGAKIGVIGHNGAGKSSVLRIMAGLDDEYTGEARLTQGFTVGYLPQEPQLDPEKTVFENVMEGAADTQAVLDEYNKVLEQWGDPDADLEKVGARQAELEDRLNALDAWDLERNVEIAMEALHLPPKESGVTTLSGGEKRRVAICRLLLSHPDLLLLDEPTNHLDAESVAWLEHALRDYTGTVIAVTHDRYFLDNVAGWILELDHGRALPFEGNYSSWLEQKHARLQMEEKHVSARQKTLARELEWARMAPKARHQKSKARLGAYDKLVEDAKRDSQQLDRLEIVIPSNKRLGDQVIDCTDLFKSFDETRLIENLSFILPPGGIVGVIGPNGAGKTTLFRMITGTEKPDAGTLTVGSTVELAYVDQSRESLNAKHSVYEEITEGYDTLQIGNREMNGRAYVASFNFKGSDQQKKLDVLSGGERNRVHLAKVLKRGGNVLLLDEPTNDLDVDTLRSLEDGLLAYPGCAVIISHDRWFLDRIATHVLAFHGDGQVQWFEGNFSDYESYTASAAD